MQLVTGEPEFEARFIHFPNLHFSLLSCMYGNMLPGGKSNLGCCLMAQITGSAKLMTVVQLKRED